jgi:aryl-alcohol dehydrogenase-like predicted oxidoreductase
VARPLSDLPPYIYGTTRLGDDDVAREQQLAMARAVLDAGLWMHTSRQYHHALEVLGEAFAEDPSRVPPLIVKLGGGTAADVRGIIADNLTPLGIDSIALGQLSPVGELADDLVTGGAPLDELRRIRDEGLVGRFVLEIFPWTSAAPLAALRAGHLDGLVDGFITYYNPLQRFAANELWDELLARDASIVSMRTVCGAPVQLLRDVPGAAWQPYLQERAVEVAPVFERSGIESWAEFCFRFVRSTSQVVATVGATSRQEHLDELMSQSQGEDTLPADVLEELYALQRRWSDEVDVRAEPWTM